MLHMCVEVRMKKFSESINNNGHLYASISSPYITVFMYVCKVMKCSHIEDKCEVET